MANNYHILCFCCIILMTKNCPGNTNSLADVVHQYNTLVEQFPYKYILLLFNFFTRNLKFNSYSYCLKAIEVIFRHQHYVPLFAYLHISSQDCQCATALCRWQDDECHENVSVSLLCVDGTRNVTNLCRCKTIFMCKEL